MDELTLSTPSEDNSLLIKESKVVKTSTISSVALSESAELEASNDLNNKPLLAVLDSPQNLETVAMCAEIPNDATSLSSDNWHTIRLPTSLTLNELNELHVELKKHTDKRLQLSGGAVKRIDTGALQLLTSLLNDPNITVGWLDCSSELCHAARWTGLQEILGLSS